jgi:hypothetical protein
MMVSCRRNDSGGPRRIDIRHCLLRRSAACLVGGAIANVNIEHCVATAGQAGSVLVEANATTPAEQPLPSRIITIAQSTYVGDSKAQFLSVNVKYGENTDLIHSPVEFRTNGLIVVANTLLRIESTFVPVEWWRMNSIHDRVFWTGERNILQSSTVYTRAQRLDGQYASQGEWRAENLARWRALWKTPADRTSRQATVTFAGSGQFSDEDLMRYGLPQHFAVVALDGVPVRSAGGVGCDVAKLPIPPPITTEPF